MPAISSVENINRVTLSGGLTRDPELRHSSAGVPFSNLRLAYAKRRGNDRAMAVETQYVDVVCRGALAVKVARDLCKGSQIYVDGQLDLRAWTDKKNGSNRQVHRVDAGTDPQSVLYLGRPSRAKGANQSSDGMPIQRNSASTATS